MSTFIALVHSQGSGIVHYGKEATFVPEGVEEHVFHCSLGHVEIKRTWLQFPVSTILGTDIWHFQVRAAERRPTYS